MSSDFGLRRHAGSVVLVVSLALRLGGALPAAGQVGTDASIIGQVADESGAVLPGVTVTATSLALQVPQVIDVTNARGEYRLTPLPIGTYQVVYELPGFRTIRRENVRLTAGFVARLDLVMQIGALEETITVSGQSPVVDVTSTSARTEFTREILESTATSRSGVISLYAQTPSVRSQLDVGGSTMTFVPAIRVYGIRSESWSMIEGIVTTESRDTQGGNYFDFNTLEEARAQTIANEADVPARGVYLNMLVKSGGNDFHGSGFLGYASHRLQGDNIDERLAALGIREGNKLKLRMDSSWDTGGRIIRDKLWFYAAARVRVNDEERLGAFKPDGSPANYYQSQPFQTGKLSYQLTSGSRLVGYYQWQRKYDYGSNLNENVAWESRQESVVPFHVGKVEWRAVRGNSLVTSLQWAKWEWVSTRPFNSSEPARRDIRTLKVTGTYDSAGGTGSAWRDYILKGTMTWYRPDLFAGNHELGVGFDHIPNYASRPWISRGASGDYILEFDNGVPFQIVALNSPVTPLTGAFHTAMWVKDNWTLARRLTLNLGVRFARDNGFVPEQCREAGVFAEAACFEKVQFPIWNSWAPRVYASYDVVGDGKTVVKGGWGRFKHFRETDEVLGANRNVATATTYRWRDLNGNRAYDPGEVNLALDGPDFVRSVVRDTGGITDTVPQPDEPQPTEDQFSISLERELMANFAFRVSGIYSRRFNVVRRLFLRRPYEVFNIPITQPDPGPDGRVGTADDPGTTLTYYDYPAAYRGRDFQANVLAGDPNATQTFKTIELAATKRLSDRWQLMASYSATKLHVPVPSEGTWDPNSEINTADRTWDWLGRVSGAYSFPRDLGVSAQFEHRSGDPWVRQVLLRGGRQIPSIVVNAEPYGTRRLPHLNFLNLRVDKGFSLAGQQRVRLQVNFYNALNINTTTSLIQRSGPTFMRPTAIVLPRIVEFGVGYSF